jgi:hypothetical protein
LALLALQGNAALIIDQFVGCQGGWQQAKQQRGSHSAAEQPQAGGSIHTPANEMAKIAQRSAAANKCNTNGFTHLVLPI